MIRRTQTSAPNFNLWLDGFPPEPGWYIASRQCSTNVFRWYNGESWSTFAGPHCQSPQRLNQIATEPAAVRPDQSPIRWLPKDWIFRLWEVV